MWNNICTQEDINRVIKSFDNFHDSCIKEIRYISGLYVDDNLCMNSTKNSIDILFNSQNVSNNNLIIRFIDVLEFNINKRNGYIHEIYDISMFIKNDCIYWADSEEFTLECLSGNWICSRQAMWKLV